MRGGRSAIIALRRQLTPGRLYRMPAPILATLKTVFEVPVDSIEVIEHSRYARAHLGMSATTRPGRILLAISGSAFITDPEFVLHEYFHVVRQWNTGALTRSGYIFESFLRGYRNNRFEIEAREFAASKVGQYTTSLRDAY